jgi:hypothetical protein
MSYDRPYSIEETKQILDASEHRPRPDSLPGTGTHGHAISLHTLERQDKWSRIGRIPKADSIFAISRNSLAPIIYEVLNSPSGQRELKKLNEENRQYVEIRTVILRQSAELEIFTVYRPKGGQSSFDWLSTTNGDGYIVQVFVLVIKIPGSTRHEIHIQTAFPEDYARTRGNEIVRPR